MSIEKLKFDKKNFNKHTEFGMSLLEKSLRQNGAGRSILVDKDDNIIAGNGIVEAAVNAGITKTKVVEVTGDELVVVKRTDLELDSKQGREMALADNATAAVDLAWDFDAIAEVETEFDIDASDWGVVLDESEQYGEEFTLPNEGKSEFGTMTFTVTEQQRDLINDCINLATYSDEFNVEENKNQNGAGLFLIATEWLQKQATTQNKSVAELEKDVKELREYLRNSLAVSGKKAVDVDRLLGTAGMSGHYFGESQWMFPTREAYEKMQTIMPLDRDWEECRLIVREYTKALALEKHKALALEKHKALV